MCATDAACEGLNLQRLGAQVNVDLPWNPSRLEQRKGRVQRIGKVRDETHILNLRYAGTVEDDVCAALSERFGDISSVLGQLPDGFEDDWIEAVLRDRAAIRHFSQRVKPPMELRYIRDVADDAGLDWEYAERVLSSRDIDAWMREGGKVSPESTSPKRVKQPTVWQEVGAVGDAAPNLLLDFASNVTSILAPVIEAFLVAENVFVSR